MEKEHDAEKETGGILFEDPHRIRNYYQRAKENEAVFRNILRDLKKNWKRRPGGRFIPQDLKTKASLEKIFKEYSVGEKMNPCRYFIFSICDFTRPTEDSAIILFEEHAILAGGGAKLEYRVKEDDSVEYKKAIFEFQG